MNNRPPAEVFPPGEFIKDELNERGWSQADLADILGRDPALVSRLITGHTSITPVTAHELSEAFDTSAELWMGLEADYRLAHAKDMRGTISERARLFNLAPVRQMQKRQWIRSEDSIDGIESELKHFFGVDSLASVPSWPMAARASATDDDEVFTAAQVAWCYQAMRMASMVEAKPYSRTRFEDGIKALRDMAAHVEEIRRVPRVLADMGVRLVIVEHLPRTRIDGAAMWIGKKPVIALSMRYDRIDCFWHTLCHELSHIRHGDKYSIDDSLVGEHAIGTDCRSAIEQRADAEAASALIDSKAMRSFIARERPYFSKESIIQFAHRQKIHSGIVVGQLQHRRAIKYSHSREMLVNVRDILISEALTDGWGRVTIAA